MRRDHAAPAQVARSFQLVQGFLGGIRILGVAADDGNASLEANNLPGAGFPGPRRFHRAEGSGRNILAVDLQRRHGRHGEALPGMLGVPQTKILTRAGR